MEYSAAISSKTPKKYSIEIVVSGYLHAACCMLDILRTLHEDSMHGHLM